MERNESTIEIQSEVLTAFLLLECFITPSSILCDVAAVMAATISLQMTGTSNFSRHEVRYLNLGCSLYPTLK